MLCFNSIGNLGRLGNQMFQYASLKGIARNRGYDFSIPPRSYFGINDDNVRTSDYIIYDIFDIENNNRIETQNFPRLSERMFNFDEKLFINCPDNVDLFGYYQTEKYFHHIENEIRQDFTFNKELLDECQSFLDDNFTSELISLHIRRGDYTQNPNHPTQTIEYYQTALNNLPEVPVIVFSDDSEWCKKQELFKPDRFIISEDNTTDADLCLMSLCQYHIIANSSFSWWGSWLAKSEKTIAPKNWFGGSCINYSTEDLYCSDWIIL